MLRQVCFLFALVIVVSSVPVPGPVTFKELPCLNKLAGQRLPNPDNPHQFLRCVAADSAWIETCPDNLFYNPHSQICDWDQIEKVTTTTTTVASDINLRPILVKFRPVSESDSISSSVVGVGRSSGIETTIVEDVVQLEMARTPSPNIVLTTVPVVNQQPLEVFATTPIASFVEPSSVTPRPNEFLTMPHREEETLFASTHATTVAQPALEVIVNTPIVPVAVTVDPIISISTTTPHTRQVTTTPAVSFEAPVVQQQQQQPIVVPVVQQQQPIVVPVAQQQPIVVQQPVVAVPVVQQQVVPAAVVQQVVPAVVQQQQQPLVIVPTTTAQAHFVEPVLQRV